MFNFLLDMSMRDNVLVLFFKGFDLDEYIFLLGQEDEIVC